MEWATHVTHGFNRIPKGESLQGRPWEAQFDFCATDAHQKIFSPPTGGGGKNTTVFFRRIRITFRRKVCLDGINGCGLARPA